MVKPFSTSAVNSANWNDLLKHYQLMQYSNYKSLTETHNQKFVATEMIPTIYNTWWRTLQERTYLPSGAVLTSEYSYRHHLYLV